MKTILKPCFYFSKGKRDSQQKLCNRNTLSANTPTFQSPDKNKIACTYSY